MTEAVFLVSYAVMALCAAFFWAHRGYDDCVWGRMSLFGMLGAFLIVLGSVVGGYRYTNILPEVALALASMASFMAWLVWRYARKRWRIRTGRDRDVPQL